MMKTEKSKDLISRADAIEAVFEQFPELRTMEQAKHVFDEIPSAEQVTGKLKNPCDPLLTDVSVERKEQKSKLDLISRQDAIEAVMNTEPTFDTRTLEPYQKEKDVVSAIESLPSAEPVHGKWIDRSEGGRILNPWWESHKCDQCGYDGSGIWNFCPNCGAKMYKGGGSE